MTQVLCPKCKNHEFVESGWAFTLCTKCKVSYIKRELVANWNRWETPEHYKWIRWKL